MAETLDQSFRVGPGLDLLATAPAVAWTAKDATLTSGKESGGFRVRGDQLPLVGVAFLPPGPEGANLSGGVLTFRYRSSRALDQATIELKPIKPTTDDSGLISRAIFLKIEATGDGVKEIRVPLPATPGLEHIKEVVFYHEGPRGPIDLTVAHFSVDPPASK